MEKKVSKAMQEKQKAVKEISEKFKKAQSVVFVDYRGIKVVDDTSLRRTCRKAGVEYTVLKNKLVLRALKGLDIKGLEQQLEGPTAFAFGFDDIVAPAKIVFENVAAKKLTAIKGGVIEGKPATQAEMNTLAQIPDKKTLIAQLLCMLNAPVRGLAVALNAIAEKK